MSDTRIHGSRIPGHGWGLVLSSIYFANENHIRKVFCVALHSNKLRVSLDLYPHTTLKLSFSGPEKFLVLLFKPLPVQFLRRPPQSWHERTVLLNVVVNLDTFFFFLHWDVPSLDLIRVYLSFYPLGPRAPTPNPAPLRLVASIRLWFPLTYHWCCTKLEIEKHHTRNEPIHYTSPRTTQNHSTTCPGRGGLRSNHSTWDPRRNPNLYEELKAPPVPMHGNHYGHAHGNAECHYRHPGRRSGEEQLLPSTDLSFLVPHQ